MVKEFQREILGSLYTFRLGTAKELGLEEKFSGDTDVHTKVIRLRTDVDDFGELGRAESIIRKTMVHEMFHAAMYETGLLDYFDDETLVQWLEVLFPKLVKIHQEIDGRLCSALHQS